jgi:hypothetical protein
MRRRTVDVGEVSKQSYRGTPGARPLVRHGQSRFIPGATVACIES